MTNFEVVTLITKEEAFLACFTKWRDEETPLRVIARLGSLHFDSSAVIFGYDWYRFSLRLPGENNVLDLHFGEDCLFNFDIHQDSQKAALVCLRPDGEIFFVENPDV